jgi:dTDP-glucose 4,6-dehydratase
MKVLVTGGAGFIGSNFVRNALGGLYPGISELIVLDKLTYAGNLENFTPQQRSQFEFIQGDICDPAPLSRIVPKIDAVVNFAAESHVDRSINGSRAFLETNTIGVQVMLDALKVKPEVRFLQVSTDEVYGSIEMGSWDENCPLQPNSPYSASKASAELVIRSYQVTFGMNIVTTRCSNNYGPYHFPEKLIPLFITNLIRGKSLPVYGNGKNVRDWLHVDDHCEGIFRVLMKGTSGEVYNIGGGEELTNLDISRLILSEFQANEEKLVFVKDRLGHDMRYSVDWSKIKNELGYTPRIDFKMGLTSTVNWYRENQAWWKPLVAK